MIDSELNIKICDFGHSLKMEDGEVSTHICGTCQYMSPEMIFNGVYTKKNDIWALGILLYEMLHGNSLFKSTSINKLKIEMKSKNFNFEIKNDISVEIQNLLKMMLK